MRAILIGMVFIVATAGCVEVPTPPDVSDETFTNVYIDYVMNRSVSDWGQSVDVVGRACEGDIGEDCVEDPMWHTTRPGHTIMPWNDPETVVVRVKGCNHHGIVGTIDADQDFFVLRIEYIPEGDRVHVEARGATWTQLRHESTHMACPDVPPG